MASSEQTARNEAHDEAHSERRFPNIGEESQGQDRSVRLLISDLAQQVLDLIRKETELAKSETSEKFSQAITGIISIVVAAMILLPGVIILLDAAVYGIGEVLPPALAPWLGAVIVGGVVTLIGLGLLMKGYSNLKARNLMLTRTTESFRHDKEFVKEQAR